MKKVLITFLLLTSTLTSLAGEREYYQKIEPRLRLEMFNRLRVRPDIAKLENITPETKESAKNNIENKIDVVKYLNEVCGFEYKRDANGQPVRPQLECEYMPRPEENGFNGMTPKFDCSFTKTDSKNQSKVQILKVKYDRYKQHGGGPKEIPQAIIGTLMARLLGFYTSTYCPADVVCKNCPNDNPWDNGGSKSAAANGSRVVFDNVVVEIKQKGLKVMDANNTDPHKPVGFYFKKELNKLYPKDQNLAQQLRIEREALTMWINFAKNRDAGVYNTKMYCLQSLPAAEENQPPICKLPIGVINDYGNSFGYKGEREKMSASRFDETPLYESNGTVYATGANGTADAHNLEVSNAGRQLFVVYAENITDQQYDDIFRLAQIETVSDSDISKWKKIFKRKIKSVKDF